MEAKSITVDKKQVKRTEIDSLSEYIELISKQKGKYSYFRGEANRYKNLNGSAFRPYNGGESGEKEFPFLEMMKEFKRSVWNNIDENTKNTFLPFCQHYGIPSNLVDISSSPITALYFACNEGKEKIERKDEFPNDNYGYVYEFSANHMVKITELIDKLDDDNFLIEISLNDIDFLYDLTRTMYNFEKRNRNGFYNLFKQLLNDYKENENLENITQSSKFNSEIHECKNITIPKIEDFYEISDDNNWKDLIAEDESMSIVSEMRPFCDATYCNSVYYLSLLRRHIKFILDFQEYLTYISGMPLFVYDPILSFSRAVNQKSVFIYQAFLSYDDDIYNHHVLPLQRIVPDEVIVIKDKDGILEELNYLGINEEFIYNDFDTIAKSIKRKYANLISKK
ncbi:MAG TPA: FRG domain-containing protein [Anaerovoracaceae bacterium]|nr:FRG domain-containing protein [Anaerovoracaceae bacterium]